MSPKPQALKCGVAKKALWFQLVDNGQMAGSRQHTIPRFLLRGFRSKTIGDNVFVWQYRRDGKAIESNIDKVAVNRDFYGPPGPGTLDDQITQLEYQYSSSLEEFRSHRKGGVVADSGDIPTLVAHFSTRTRFLRQSMEDSLGMFLERLFDRLADRDALAALLQGPIGRQQLLELLVRNGVPTDQAHAALPMLLPMLPQAVAAAIPNLPEYIDFARKFARHESRDVIRKAHLTALAEDPSLPKRAELYRALSWHLFIVDVPLILGDTVCVFESNVDRRFKPLDDADGTYRIYFPVSADRVLVGTPYRARPKFDPARLNRSIARCSYEFFVSSRELRVESGLHSSLGKWSGIIPDNELQAICDKVGLE